MTQAHDVAIVGGGAVGASLALGLARGGFDVALVEPHAPPAHDAAAPHDLRTYAMSPASIALLTRLDAWAGVVARRVSPYERMAVWADDASRGIAFDASLVGERALGAIVEDRVLRDALWQRVLAEPAIARCESALSSFAADRGGVRLVLADGAEVRASLAVAADGARSSLRALAGLDANADAAPGERTAPLKQRAVVANLRTELPHEQTAWQRFTGDGPLAFLPLSNGECSIVWSLPDARAGELLALDDVAFRECVGASFQHRLGRIVSCSERAAFPLAPMLAPRYAGERVVLVGDAAHVVLPLAGQGLNLGLLDVGALFEVLGEAGRGALGAAATLARYERWRRADNALAAHGFALLDRLFRSTSPGIAWLRATGLSVAGSIAPLRRELALQASGFAGRVPALSRRLS